MILSSQKFGAILFQNAANQVYLAHPVCPKASEWRVLQTTLLLGNSLLANTCTDLL